MKSKCKATEKTGKTCCKKTAAKKTVKAKAATKNVAFTVRAEAGKAVYLAGDFNAWNPTGKKLVDKKGDGVYAGTIKLAPGSYQYKFVIDGTWCADPENVNSVQNDQGTFNSVVVVK